jgi:hypothetical protein
LRLQRPARLRDEFLEAGESVTLKFLDLLLGREQLLEGVDFSLHSRNSLLQVLLVWLDLTGVLVLDALELVLELVSHFRFEFVADRAQILHALLLLALNLEQ